MNNEIIIIAVLGLAFKVLTFILSVSASSSHNAGAKYINDAGRIQMEEDMMEFNRMQMENNLRESERFTKESLDFSDKCVTPFEMGGFDTNAFSCNSFDMGGGFGLF